MTSKELEKILNKTRRTKNIELSVKQVEKIIKDLEVKEEQDKKLEILKEWLVYDEYEDAIMTYTDIPLELKEKIKRWLDNEA